MWWQRNDKTTPGQLADGSHHADAAGHGAGGAAGALQRPAACRRPIWCCSLAGLFGVLANLGTIFTLLRRGVQLSGGAVAHLGIALMLLGILASAGYSNIISRNVSGLLYSREFAEELNRDNVLLWRNETTPMQKLRADLHRPVLRGARRARLRGQAAPLPHRRRVQGPGPRATSRSKDKTYYKTGDTARNSCPRIPTTASTTKTEKSGEQFTLYPRAQVNEEMGGLLASPAIKQFWRPRHLLARQLGARPAQGKALERGEGARCWPWATPFS